LSQIQREEIFYLLGFIITVAASIPEIGVALFIQFGALESVEVFVFGI
jgi:hypothetical protein